jgi:membrane protein YqaA with SNARE-associated domain
MFAYIGLFASALVAATLLPMQSEAVLTVLLIAREASVFWLLVVATVGNVLGSVINWILGRFILRFEGRRWFPATPAQLARAQDWYARWGLWSLLASWVPVVGDPLTVMAGVMRVRLLPFIVLVTLAKGGRYLVLATVVLHWTS